MTSPRGRAGGRARLAPWLILVLLCGFAAAAEDAPEAQPQVAEEAATIQRVLFLGDSYTAGVQIPPEETWHAQLVERLRGDGLELDPEVIAVSGWRVLDVMRGLDERSPKPPFALALIFIGSNDHFHRELPIGFRRDLDRLFARVLPLVEGEGGRLIVLGMPDWTVTPYGERFEIPPAMVSDVDAYNEVLREVARANGATFVELLALSRAQASVAENFVADGLHASGRLGRLWAEAAFAPSKRVLESATNPQESARVPRRVLPGGRAME